MWRIVEASKGIKEVVGAAVLIATTVTTLLARWAAWSPSERYILIAVIVAVLAAVVVWQAISLRRLRVPAPALEGTDAPDARIRELEERLSGKAWPPIRSLFVTVEAMDDPGPTFTIISDTAVRVNFGYIVHNVGPFPVKVPQVAITFHGKGKGFSFSEHYELLTGWKTIQPANREILIVDKTVATRVGNVGHYGRLGVTRGLIATSDEWDGDQKLVAGGWVYGRVLDERPQGTSPRRPGMMVL